MKVAIVYDRVNKWGGAERVLLALHKIYPKAPLFTSVYDPKNAPWAKVFPKVYTSFLQKFPLARNNHEYLAILMPFVFRLHNFSGYDLVISVTSEFAKNIKVDDKTCHICYCLTPTRYLWSGYKEYFGGFLYSLVTYPAVQVLRFVDKKAALRPDVIIGISSEVRNRIKKYYNRDSEIIFPPVEIGAAKNNRRKRAEYYLLVSRLDYGYKKVDLAIKVFNKLEKKLIIVGIGREMSRLKKLAKNNIEFAGKVSEAELKKYYLNARALIMPQAEDFGIVAVEAQMYGVPVIAYKKGGALDTVVNNKTGIFFNSQNERSLSNAILRFEKMRFRVDNLFTNAKKFSFGNFKRKFVKIVEHVAKRRKL